MRNYFLLSLAALGLAAGTVQAGTLSADTDCEHISADLADVTFEPNDVQNLMLLLGDLLVLTNEDGVTKIFIKDGDAGLQLVGVIAVENNGEVATLVFVDGSSGQTIVITYSDASEMPDVTTLEGLCTMIVQLGTIINNN